MTAFCVLDGAPLVPVGGWGYHGPMSADADASIAGCGCLALLAVVLAGLGFLYEWLK